MSGHCTGPHSRLPKRNTSHGVEHCIIAIHADKGLCDFNAEFKKALASDSARLVTTLTAGAESCTITAQGSSRLTLDHPTDIVWRRSSYIDSRTVAIYADCTAQTLPRKLIAELAREEKMTVDMEIFTIPEEERSSVPQIQAFFHRHFYEFHPPFIQGKHFFKRGRPGFKCPDYFFEFI